jgi:hypothetical protein
MNIINCFDGKWKAIDKGTLKDGNGNTKFTRYRRKLIRNSEL